MGQCDKALPMHLEALDNTEKTLGKNHATYGVRLNNLALLYQTTGQYNKALPLFQEALENTEKTLGKNNFIYGIRLNNLALFYETTGQYDKALPLFLEALDNTEKTLGKNHSIYSNRLNNLAGLYMTMGQYNKAIRMFLEALDNTEKTLGKNHEDYGTWLNNLAVLLRRMGQYNNALPLSLGALEITEKTLGKNHATYGVRLNNLALLYHSMEQYEKALSLYVEAIENCEKTLGKNHTSYSVGLNNLAGLYQTMDKHDKALPIYLEALENVEKTLGRNHLDYGTHLNNLALLYHTIGQYDKALPHYLVAKENIEKNLVSNFTFMDEKFKENYLKNIHYIFEVHNSFYTKYHIELPSGKSHIFDNELLMKSLILQSSANINNFINNSKDTIIVHKAQVLKALKNIIIKEETKSLSEQRKDLGDLVEKAERLEGELSRLSNQFAEFQSIGKIKTNDISKALKTNEVAVEFASFDYHDGRKWTDSIIYVALVLRQQDSIPLMVTLFEEKQLDSLLRSANLDKDVITQIYRGSSPVGSQPISKQIHNKLYNLIWKPIVPYLNKGDKVYYAPSGKLHNVSMAAIASSDTTYLSDDYELQQVSTTAKLSGEQKAKIDIDEITMYGGIAYDASDEKIKATIPISSSTNIASRNVAHDSIRGETWNYLSGTKSEVDYISSLAAKYNINTTSYTDHKATEESYKNLQGKSSPSILHIATHGFFYPIKKKSKKDLEMMQFNQEPVFTYSENPLNRSGLLFAGSNKSWQGIIPEDREDGILTAFEASNVYLPNTKLAVLSACETGLGDIKGSEGVYGMQRALKMAGVEYLLISLWKVPDAATSEYMTIFYEDLFKNKNIETAYQKAQKDMKKKYPNEPWMWGGFVLVR
jgi:CHAT domain-containing protein